MKRKPVETFDYVDAMPINGYLTHAVPNMPEYFHRTAPFLVITYRRALCGVGAGGMKVRLNKAGEIQPFKGIDGCNTCHARLHRIKESQR